MRLHRQETRVRNVDSRVWVSGWVGGRYLLCARPVAVAGSLTDGGGAYLILLLMLIGVVLTVVVWSSFGPIWGVVTGLLFVGGFGWKVLFSVGGALAPNREGRQEFVEAWEARSGEMQFGRSRTYPPGGAYKRWMAEREGTGESAASWMDRTMGVSPGAPIYGYQGQATNAFGHTLYPWQSNEFRKLRHELRAVKEPGGGLEWQVLSPGDAGYFESIAFVLNKHLGWDRHLGPHYLQDLADGVPKETSINSTVQFLMTDGHETLARLREETTTEATLDDALEVASNGIKMLRHYTGADKGYDGAPELAAAALKDQLTPERMREVPSQYLPEKIVGFGKTEGESSSQPPESAPPGSVPPDTAPSESRLWKPGDP